MTVSEWQKATAIANGNEAVLVHVDHMLPLGWQPATATVVCLDEYFEIREVVWDADAKCWIVRLGGIV